MKTLDNEINRYENIDIFERVHLKYRYLKNIPNLKTKLRGLW